MTTMHEAALAPQQGPRATRSSPVIVATDGHDQSNSAMLMAQLLAGEKDALRVISVLRSLPVVAPAEAPATVSADFESARLREQTRIVRQQAGRVWNDDAIDVEVTEGDPATCVAQFARRTNATLIVAGLGRHRIIDRLFGDETALRLVRVAASPVYAVPSGPAHAPARIVVAVDFSETSLRAARLALEVAAPRATIYLVHVAPRDATLSDWSEYGTSYKENAGNALYKLREQLRIPRGIAVQRILLQGDPATELLAFAASVNADLVATGSHGHGFVTRILVGSVTTRILRCATCSVLCVPHAAAMTKARVTAERSITTTMTRSTWREVLEDFTRHNAGRRAALEVDDPDLDAQAQENNYPLIGATYDDETGRVELLLGEIGGIGRQLTRAMGDVDRIEILTNESGREIALRMTHGAGQTLLTLSA
jgi:nucleotide-binding universal stress UspA family protein